MKKTHYASHIQPNESDPDGFWGITWCGLEYTESPCSNNINEVTCKNCLKRYKKYESKDGHN